MFHVTCDKCGKEMKRYYEKNRIAEDEKKRYNLHFCPACFRKFDKTLKKYQKD